MDYEHDVFVSYCRSDQHWVKWTRENFYHALRSFMGIGGYGSIYLDDSIDTGDDWPHHLAYHLSRSKILLPILSRDFFRSRWCRLELGLMYKREKLTNSRSDSLIVPIVIDDGDSFPPEVRRRQLQLFHKLANPFTRLDSPKQEALGEAVRDQLCPRIERALKAVPNFDPTWEQIAYEQFDEMFAIAVPMQITVPSINLPQLP